jgi:hypothetical protein
MVAIKSQSLQDATHYDIANIENITMCYGFLEGMALVRCKVSAIGKCDVGFYYSSVNSNWDHHKFELPQKQSPEKLL